MNTDPLTPARRGENKENLLCPPVGYPPGGGVVGW